MSDSAKAAAEPEDEQKPSAVEETVETVETVETAEAADTPDEAPALTLVSVEINQGAGVPAWADGAAVVERNAPLIAFVRRLIDLRKSRLWLRRDTFLKGTRRGADTRDVTWLHPSGREMTEPDWHASFAPAR